MNQYYTFSSSDRNDRPCPPPRPPHDCQPIPPCRPGQTCPMPPAPQPTPDCCRQQGLSAVLQMLQSGVFASRINFNAFAFLTGDFVAGAYLTAPVSGNDNLSALSGSFLGLPGQMPGLADFAGTAVWAEPLTAADLTAGRLNDLTIMTGSLLLSLDETDAVVFSLLNPSPEEYAALRQLFLQQLCQMHPYIPSQGCREALTGAAALLTTGAPGRTVSLAVGGLVLINVEMLGFVGDILLLGSPTDSRFYLVRGDKISILQ